MRDIEEVDNDDDGKITPKSNMLNVPISNFPKMRRITFTRDGKLMVESDSSAPNSRRNSQVPQFTPLMSRVNSIRSPDRITKHSKEHDKKDENPEEEKEKYKPLFNFLAKNIDQRWVRPLPVRFEDRPQIDTLDPAQK